MVARIPQISSTRNLRFSYFLLKNIISATSSSFSWSLFPPRLPTKFLYRYAFLAFRKHAAYEECSSVLFSRRNNVWRRKQITKRMPFCWVSRYTRVLLSNTLLNLLFWNSLSLRGAVLRQCLQFFLRKCNCNNNDIYKEYLYINFSINGIFFDKDSVIFNTVLPTLSKALYTKVAKFHVSTSDYITKALFQFVVVRKIAST
jgi:hypothetical protein